MTDFNIGDRAQRILEDGEATRAWMAPATVVAISGAWVYIVPDCHKGRMASASPGCDCKGSEADGRGGFMAKNLRLLEPPKLPGVTFD